MKLELLENRQLLNGNDNNPGTCVYHDSWDLGQMLSFANAGIFVLTLPLTDYPSIKSIHKGIFALDLLANGITVGYYSWDLSSEHCQGRNCPYAPFAFVGDFFSNFFSTIGKAIKYGTCTVLNQMEPITYGAFSAAVPAAVIGLVNGSLIAGIKTVWDKTHAKAN